VFIWVSCIKIQTYYIEMVVTANQTKKSKFAKGIILVLLTRFCLISPNFTLKIREKNYILWYDKLKEQIRCKYLI
jgi:hypothetical protein